MCEEWNPTFSAFCFSTPGSLSAVLNSQDHFRLSDASQVWILASKRNKQRPNTQTHSHRRTCTPGLHNRPVKDPLFTRFRSYPDAWMLSRLLLILSSTFPSTLIVFWEGTVRIYRMVSYLQSTQCMFLKCKPTWTKGKSTPKAIRNWIWDFLAVKQQCSSLSYRAART